MLELITKEEFLEEIFTENKEMFEEYMKKHGHSKKDVISDLAVYIHAMKTPLYLSNDEGGWFQIKEVKESLPVILGYYEIMEEHFNKKKLDPNMKVQQCTIFPTKKGEEIYKKYKECSN